MNTLMGCELRIAYPVLYSQSVAGQDVSKGLGNMKVTNPIPVMWVGWQ